MIWLEFFDISLISFIKVYYLLIQKFIENTG